MTTYKEVFARFAFTPELEAEVSRIADAMLAEWGGRASERLPRVAALRSAPEFREGFGIALRDVADGYRCYEHMTFCELVPGYKERHASWAAADPATRPPDPLSPDELLQAERILMCALALGRAIHKAFYPYHAQTYVPFEEFAATVRRAFASQGYTVMTNGTPRA